MKNKFLIKALCLACVMLSLFSIESCGKYEEGPSFTLRSKKARAVNNWKLDKVYDANGTDITQATTYGLEFDMDIADDNTYVFLLDGATFDTGTWDFSDDKMQIIFTSNDPNTTITPTTIIKLENNEYWDRDDTGVEYHYVTK